LAPTVGIAATGFGIRAGSFNKLSSTRSANFFVDKINEFFIDKISKFFIDKISKFFIDKISDFCDCHQQQPNHFNKSIQFGSTSSSTSKQFSSSRKIKVQHQ
jgi:hypothetical protein